MFPALPIVLLITEQHADEVGYGAVVTAEQKLRESN